MAKKDTQASRGGGVVTNNQKEETKTAEAMAKKIEDTFNKFKVPVKITEVMIGVRNYHFYLEPTKPTRMRVFNTFLDDLRFALSCDKIEIEAPIPDTSLVGIVVPKKGDAPVLNWAGAIKSKEAKLITIPLGMDEFGRPHLINIARMPHMLIGGTTGSGKSMLLHSFIASLITNNTPYELRLLLIDPKRVELTIYDGLPHLITPVITQPKKAMLSLKWAVKEMERRYDILESERMQNISSYHSKVYKPSVKSKASKVVEPLPFIIIIFDEIADIMHAYPRECEALMVRLAQMSRAVGIHLIISTQRPSVNVITGTMKANIPTRIAMQVASQIDSRTILDVAGAEKLQGNGDMLFLSGEMVRPSRIQAYYMSDDEIVKLIKEDKKKYDGPSEDIDLEGKNEVSSMFASIVDEDEDDMYEEARLAVIEAGKASTSYMQRKLQIGYSRAARLIDILEERGVIGPADGAKPREVLIGPDDE